MKQLSLPVISLLLMTPVLISVGQVLFKMTSTRLAEAANPGFMRLPFEPLFLLALAIYGGATVLWIFVLKSVPLAYAYSFMALTFVLVPLLAAWWFGETLTLRYGLGAALIIGGLLVVHT